MAVQENERAVSNFREYLKIRSVHPNPDYDGCVKLLRKLGSEIGLKTNVINLSDNHPVLILTLEGECPELPSILLNSHMDVVPVNKDKWKQDPFGAFIDERGNIYGRGAQDMKGITISQLEAIRRIKTAGVKLKRTLHVTVLPDEEIGSAEGMEKFVKTNAFKNLNIGFDLDEGCVSPNNKMELHQDERFRWAMLIHCPGTTGHGSLLLNDTAGEKVRIVLDRFMDMRKEEVKKLQAGHTLSEVTSINLTTLQGGVQNNVVPTEIVAGFDMRISLDRSPKEMEKWINDVCKEAGKGVYPEYLLKDDKAPEFNLDNNQFWKALEGALKQLGLEFHMAIGFGASDARFARRVGIPALGLSPFINTELRVHADDEYLNKEEFLRGISRYVKIIMALANC